MQIKEFLTFVTLRGYKIKKLSPYLSGQENPLIPGIIHHIHIFDPNKRLGAEIHYKEYGGWETVLNCWVFLPNEHRKIDFEQAVELFFNK